MSDANVRDGQLDGRPLLDGLHAKDAGQGAVKGRDPEDKVRPAARIRQGPGCREGGSRGTSSTSTRHAPSKRLS